MANTKDVQQAIQDASDALHAAMTGVQDSLQKLRQYAEHKNTGTIPQLRTVVEGLDQTLKDSYNSVLGAANELREGKKIPLMNELIPKSVSREDLQNEIQDVNKSITKYNEACNTLRSALKSGNQAEPPKPETPRSSGPK